MAVVPRDNPFDLPTTLVVDGIPPTPVAPADTVEVRSMAAVPRQATMRVVVAASDASDTDPMITRLDALGYWGVTPAGTDRTEPGVFYREGFEMEAAIVVADLGMTVTPQPLTTPVSDADDVGDVVVIVGS